MQVRILKKTFSKRDASLAEIDYKADFVEKPLREYLDRMKVTIADQKGYYRSLQGPSITPQPFWCIEFDVVEKRISGESVIQPRKVDDFYVAKTIRWAKDVAGTGEQKEKWRGMSLEGPISSKYLYSVVSSTWLAPFAIVHRYFVAIPAIVSAKGNDAKLALLKDIARDDRMDVWTITDGVEDDKTIIEWTKKAQKLWEGSKTDKANKLVTEWLNYNGKIEYQKPRSLRVVHTRSRALYAAVLQPSATTALGLPLSKAILKTRSGIEIKATTEIPVAGTIIDNMLHSIEVGTVEEGYWLSGIFNSIIFGNLVLKRAGGKRGSEYVPSIYSLPVKILDEKSLVFDPSDSDHGKIAQLAQRLENQMAITARKYYPKEKSLPLEEIDDSVESPEVAGSNARVFKTRLAENSKVELEKLENLVKSIL